MEVEIKKKKINIIFPEPNMIAERIDVKDCLKATSWSEIDQLITDDSYIFKKQAHKGYLWYYPEHSYLADTVINHHPRQMPTKADHVIDLLFLPHVYKNKGIAVITHSELFFLRIQRRIRETAEGKATPDSKFLRAKDVNVLCVDKEIEVVPIKLDKRGDFVTEWPNGFFTEAMDEI